MIWNRDRWTRRQLLGASIASAGALVIGCSGDSDDAADATATQSAGTPEIADTPSTTSTQTTLAPTPACTDDDDVTPTQTEGPYFTPDSPERASLVETGMAGEKLVVTGRVLSTDCAPIAEALIDFWQADNDGVYDNEGYRLRGHQFAGDDGAFRLETITPGLYPGRTRHIHVKVQAPDRSVLTTQLYFPGESANASDGIFDEALLMNVSTAADGKTAAFDFVLAV